MGCKRWDELEFIKFCESKLSEKKLIEFYAHLDKCRDCRDRFTLSWELLTSDNSSEEYDQEVRKILKSKRWQSYIAGMASKHAGSIRARLGRDSNKPTEKRHNPAKVFSNRPISRQNLIAAIFIAIALIIPISGIYFFISKEKANKEAIGIVGIDRSGAVNQKGEVFSNMTAFEKVNAQLQLNPDDSEALFERGQRLEKLYLYEAAQADFQRYLLMTGSVKRQEVAERLVRITEKINKPVSRLASHYDQLEQLINDYLTQLTAGTDREARVILQRASNLADEMERSSGDRYGVDLISYYREVSHPVSSELLAARETRLTIEHQIGALEFSEILAKLYRAKATFLKFNAQCEIEQTDIQIINFLNFDTKFDEAEALTKTSIPQVTNLHHLYSKARLLLSQGQNLADRSKFDGALESLEESMKLAQALDVTSFSIRASMSLTLIYYVMDENSKAIETAYNILPLIHEVKDEVRLMQLAQTISINAFSLKYPALAKLYINESIRLAEKKGNLYTLALSQSFAGIMSAEEHEWDLAEKNFNDAFNSSEKLKDASAQAVMNFYVTGYYARSQLLVGNIERATKFYNQAIALSEGANIQQKLPIGQLHQGLSECYLAQGKKEQAENELAVATTFYQQAEKNSERNNSLLSFAIAHDR